MRKVDIIYYIIFYNNLLFYNDFLSIMKNIYFSLIL